MDEQQAIRVVIIEDHMMVAEGLRAALLTQPDLEVVGIAGSLRQGLHAVAHTQPDVVLMDCRLPDGNGAQAGSAVREAALHAAVLVITADAGSDIVAAALQSGCAGLLEKGSGVEQVARAIRDVHAGESVFSRSMLAGALRPRERRVETLTERELEVLRRLHDGAPTAQIAKELVLSVHTVRNHIRNLTAKLGAHTRLEALARARQEGLLEEPVLTL